MAKKSKRRQRMAARQAAQRRRWLTLALAVAVVLGSAGAWLASRPQAPPVPETRLAVEHGRGPVDAPVVITEFGDFNCPSCKRYFELGIIDRVLSAYPEEVRFVFRHFPVITPASPRLAEAAECAADQGAFWEFHDLLYNESPSGPGEMLDFARRLGLDEAAFQACYESRQYADLVERQMQEAFALGFRGTPSFMVNDTRLAGPPTYESLISIVESALAAP